MELALEIGQPAEFLARMMTEREFRRWIAYRGKRMWPMQRMEMYLAQIAQLIAITMGGAKEAKITDYLIELRQAGPVESEVVDLKEIREAFGYSPRKRKG